ncbi:hypothetical protein HK098_008022 [Nowakowskiella sp. JEL0407]|nr:hypothetical protein HK098_008022 [Nowakowskiella sp. JEL0407]
MEPNHNNSFQQPRTSLTHPINISWLFPPELLLVPPLALVADVDLLSFIRPENSPVHLGRPLSIPVIPFPPVPQQQQCISTDAVTLLFNDGPKIAKLPTPSEEPETKQRDDTSNKDREEVEEVEAGLVENNGIISTPGDEELLKGSHAPSSAEFAAAPYEGFLKSPPLKHGNFALSSCPGKKVRLDTGPVHGRAMINRDLGHDFERLKSFGIDLVVCCLNDGEMEFLGAPWSKYKAAAEFKNIEIVRIPMIEGQAPDSIDAVEEVLKIIEQKLRSGSNVLCHCRGGIGRAGLIACCYLLRNGYCGTPDRAIQFVRIRRSLKAIETPKQEEFILQYFNSIIKS